MHCKHHIARRRSFFSSLPWGNDNGSSRDKLGVSLKSLSSVLHLSRKESWGSVKNRAIFKYYAESTVIKHWYFSRILFHSILRVTTPDRLALVITRFQDTLEVIITSKEWSFAKCNRWRNSKNSFRSFISYLKARMPVSQTLNKECDL